MTSPISTIDANSLPNESISSAVLHVLIKLDDDGMEEDETDELIQKNHLV